MICEADLLVAAEAGYIAGVAATGAPVTNRIRVGYRSLAVLVHDAAGRSPLQVAEATLHLGHLEGTWAIAYQRREQLIDSQHAVIGAGWHDLDEPDVIGRVVKAAQQAGAYHGLGESAADVLALMRGLIANALRSLAGLPGWRALRAAFAQAVMAGRAEGTAAALAIAADRAGDLGEFSWDLAFEHAWSAMADYRLLFEGIADQWLNTLLNGVAYELGPVLARLIEARADHDVLVAAVRAAFSLDAAAARLVTDWMVTAAVSDGALALYTSEGVMAIEFLTAGDDRVCPICEANEENGPYAPDNCPRPGRHPYCRCTLAAALNPGTFAPYLK